MLFWAYDDEFLEINLYYCFWLPLLSTTLLLWLFSDKTRSKEEGLSSIRDLLKSLLAHCFFFVYLAGSTTDDLQEAVAEFEFIMSSTSASASAAFA